MASEHDNDLIEQYLSGHLVGQELVEFEKRLADENGLADEVKLTSDILQSIRAVGRRELKNQLNSITQKNKPISSQRKKGYSIAFKLSIAASLTLIIGSGIWLYFKTELFIKPLVVQINNQATPIPGVQVPMETHEANNSESSTIAIKSGEFISIPKGCLTDKNGDPLKKQVTISFTSLRNLFDQFVSGIPTAIDSSGHLMYLKTDAIFKLYALASSEVKFNSLKPLEVILPVSDTTHNYRVYKLDTLSKRWIANTSGITIDILKDSDPSNPNMVKPRLENKFKRRFMIKIDEKLFPELAQYKNYIFEIAPEERNYEPNDENILWKNIVVTRGAKDNPYQVTFSNPSKTVTYKVVPVFSAEYIAQAKRLYEKELKKYLAASPDSILLRKFEIAKRIAKAGKRNTHQFFKAFSITSPGYYANSRLQYAPTQIQNVEIEDRLGNSLSLSQVAVADFSMGILYRLKAGRKVQLPQRSKEDQVLLGITSKNQFAYLTSDEYQQIQLSQKNVQVHIVNLSDINYPELRKRLGDKGLALVLSYLQKK